MNLNYDERQNYKDELGDEDEFYAVLPVAPNADHDKMNKIAELTKKVTDYAKPVYRSNKEAILMSSAWIGGVIGGVLLSTLNKSIRKEF